MSFLFSRKIGKCLGKWNDTKKRISVSRIFGSFARVFPNLCILLTKYAPLYQEEFTWGREGGCCRGLFRVTENTDDVFCVKAGDFYFFFAWICAVEGEMKKRALLCNFAYFAYFLASKKNVNQLILGDAKYLVSRLLDRRPSSGNCHNLLRSPSLININKKKVVLHYVSLDLCRTKYLDNKMPHAFFV